MNKKIISLTSSIILFILTIFTLLSPRANYDFIYLSHFIIILICLLLLLVIIIKNTLFIIKGEDNYYDLNKFYKLNIYSSILTIIMLVSVLIFNSSFGTFEKLVFFCEPFIIMATISVLLNIYLIVLKKRKIKVKKNKNIEKVSN